MQYNKNGTGTQEKSGQLHTCTLQKKKKRSRVTLNFVIDIPKFLLYLSIKSYMIEGYFRPTAKHKLSQLILHARNCGGGN